MTSLFFEVLWQILRFEYYVSHGDFNLLRQKVRESPQAPGAPATGLVDEISRAADHVCLWYPKPVLCLQRSAATACVMKGHGLAAQLVIGAQALPFKAHAWVEVGNTVVNDKPCIRERYMVLDLVESRGSDTSRDGRSVL